MDFIDCKRPHPSIQQLFQYDIHPRFKTLEGQSISGRLFLAALFAATKSIVPDYALGMTGEEQACILVRQCQLNRPFSPIELHILLNLKGLSRGKSATLSLLCHDLQRSAFEFDFLHHPSEPTAESSHMDHLDFFDDSSAYLAIRGPVSCRVLLTSCESRRIIGSVKEQSRTKTKRHDVVPLEIDECPVSRKVINSLYTSFSDLWSEGAGVQREFPLKHSTRTNLGSFTVKKARFIFTVKKARFV